MESQGSNLPPSKGEKPALGGSISIETSHYSPPHDRHKSDSLALEAIIEPKNVNIHQFYPVLEHTFAKDASTFAAENQDKMEVAIKQFMGDEEDGGGGSAEVAGVEDAGKEGDADADVASKPADGGEKTAGNDAQPEHDGMFSTAVDEDTLEAARQRNQNNGIFNTDDWQTEASVASPSMDQIIQERTAEHIARAHEMADRSQFKEAINCLTKAISLQPSVSSLYVDRAENYLLLCDFQSAVLNYKKACLLEPGNGPFYSRLAFLYYFQGQMVFDQHLYAEALESFSRAAEMEPENIGYQIRSISCLAALQRHGECLALINKRLEKDNSNPDLYIMRARLHNMYRNATLCYYDVKDALTIDCEHIEARSMMAAIEQRADDNKTQAVHLNVLGKFREALQKISVSIDTNPSLAAYHVLRGALHRKLHDFNAAIDDFLLALDKCDHDEDDPVYGDSQRQLLLTYNDFAVECFSKEFYEEAIILLNKAIKGEKYEKGLYINRGDCFFKQHELNFALQDYHQALELDVTDQATKSRIAVIHNQFGIAAYQKKNYAESEAKFIRAIQFNPHVGQYYISRARTRFMMENSNGARQDLILGLLLDPTNEDVISVLSRLFPGKSVADVINSPAANSAKQSLQNMVATASPIRLKSLKKRDSNKDIGGADGKNVGTDARLGAVESHIPRLALCIEEMDFNLKFAREKKTVHVKVKQALCDRKSLKYTGPRMAPLPPVNTLPTYDKSHRKRVVIEPELKKGKSTGWKTHSLGISAQN